MIAVLAFVAMDHDISLPELCINKLDVGQKPADLILSFKDAIDRLIDICPQVLHFSKRIPPIIQVILHGINHRDDLAGPEQRQIANGVFCPDP